MIRIASHLPTSWSAAWSVRETRPAYTVHGDKVNLTTSLEQLYKEYGTRIILSDSTLVQIPQRSFDFRKLGEVAVRGLNRPVRIYILDQAQT
ncbi:MAG: hypothetical protein OEN02_18435 [Gammaproteobacteria bacterium]|nr:hypothetical protein [Gammaproteobacteria bacterium]